MKYLSSFIKSTGALLAVLLVVGVLGGGAFMLRHPDMFKPQVHTADAVPTDTPPPMVFDSPTPPPPSPVAPVADPSPTVAPPAVAPIPPHATQLPTPHMSVGSTVLFTTASAGSGSYAATNANFNVVVSSFCSGQDGANIDPNGSVVTVRWEVNGDTRTYSEYWGDVNAQYIGPATVNYSISVRGTCSWRFWVSS